MPAPAADPRPRRASKALASLAGLACVACCALPVLIAAGVLGAGAAAVVDWLPALAMALAALAAGTWWAGQRRRSCSCTTSASGPGLRLCEGVRPRDGPVVVGHIGSMRPSRGPVGRERGRVEKAVVTQQQDEGLVAAMERHQVAAYLTAMAAGAVVGLAAPSAGPSLEHAINPVLAALLYVTFLQVPAAELLRSLRAGRFLAAALVVNFVVVPASVAGLFAFLPDDQAVRIGVVLVLLAPCVDYVIVFSGLAGGSSQRLLAATPLLLLAQMLLLPPLLWLFMGPDLGDVVEAGPFLEAFVFLIVIPLALAWLTQGWAARHPAGQRTSDAASAAMVPLMAATLFTVVASQVPKLGGSHGLRRAHRRPSLPPGWP